MLGDNAYNDGTDTQYQAAVFDMYPTLLAHSQLWPTRGNHDDLYDGSNNDYFDFFTLPTSSLNGAGGSQTEAYYSFDYANIHFISLDSEDSDRSVHGPMLTWLEADLVAANQEWIIAFWHQPPYSDGSHNSNDPGPMTELRLNALPILEEFGVDLVLCGHSHAYERSCLLHGHYGLSQTLVDSMRLDQGDGSRTGDGVYHKPYDGQSPFPGTVYAVVGCSGFSEGGTFEHPAMVVTDTIAGSLVLDINDNILDAQFIDLTGRIIDSFTVVKEPPGAIVRQGGITSIEPNPVQHQTNIHYYVKTAEMISLNIYDVRGCLVRSLVQTTMNKGPQSIAWDGCDLQQRPVPSGSYLAVLQSGSGVYSTKIIVTH